MVSILAACFAFDLNAQSIKINGTIVNNQTLESVRGIHIFTEEHVGTISDGDGNFTFFVNYLDTLHFTGVGYDSLAVIIAEPDKFQQLFISMKSSTRILNEIEIKGIYQAPTIVKLPEKEVYPVPGVYYPLNPRGKNYRLGVGGAIFSPATAFYRMFSKRYKEEKKAHLWNKKKAVEDSLFAQASKNLDEVFELTNEYLDDYYYRDFIQYSGLNLRFVAESSQYDLLEVLPQALKVYREYLSSVDKE